MFRVLVAIFAIQLSIVGALAQNTRQPANMTTVPTISAPTQDLDVLDSTGTWAPVGTIDPTKHNFTPVGGGSSGAAGVVNAQSVGMQPSTTGSLFDNAPLLPNLRAAVGPATGATYGFSSVPVNFPGTPGTQTTEYYFSRAIDWTRPNKIFCGGVGAYNTTTLIFAAGVNGVIADTGDTGPDSAWSAGGTLEGCNITTMGYGQGDVAEGSTSLTTSGFRQWGAVPPETWGVGDGVIAAPLLGGFANSFPSGHILSVPGGTYLVSGSGSSFTMSNPAIYDVASTHHYLYRLPAALAYNVTTIAPVTTTATAAFLATDTVIHVASCAGVFPNENVYDTTIGGTNPNIGFVGSCSGTTLTLAWNKGYASSGTTDTIKFASNMMFMTGGPDILIQRGDLLWTDAFPFGAMIWASYNTVNDTSSGAWSNSTTITLSSPCPTQGIIIGTPNAGVLDVTANRYLGFAAGCSGSTLTMTFPSSGASGDTLALPVLSNSLPLAAAAGHQSLIVVGSSYNVDAANPFNAAVAHSAGSGKMWNIPAGILHRNNYAARANVLQGWPIGISQTGSSGTTPPSGGSDNWNSENTIGGGLIGFMTLGNNVAASTSYANLFGGNNITDELEGESIGSVFLGDNLNSYEGGYAPFSVIGNCTFQSATFIGMYVTVGTKTPFCMDFTTGALDVPPKNPPNPGAGPLFIGALDGTPTDANGLNQSTFSGGQWTFQGPGNYQLTASAPTASGTVVTLDTQPFLFAGVSVTDLTHPTVIPSGTTVTSLTPYNFTMSNALTGGGVLANDVIQFSTVAAPPCFGIGAGIYNLSGFFMSKDCGGYHGLNLAYSGYRNAWGYGGGGNQTFFEFALANDYLGNTSDGNNHIVIPNGFLLGSGQGLGTERFFQSDPNPPSDSFHKQGDMQFNAAPVAGGIALWVETANGGTYRPAARIANDQAGTSWPVATPVVIASLVACGPSTVGFGVVTNGVAVGTAGYGAAVSATGAVTRPVFCDGASWTYH